MTAPSTESIVQQEHAQLDYSSSMSYGDYLDRKSTRLNSSHRL